MHRSFKAPPSRAFKRAAAKPGATPPGQIAQRGWGAQAPKGKAPKRPGIAKLRVCPAPGRRSRGTLLAGAVALPCAIGAGGRRADKREGDGATPRGTFPLLSAFYRPDRGPRPRCCLPLRRSEPADGWCDDAGHPNYNRPVRLPFGAGHERMWRDDRLYDLGLVLDHNVSRTRRGRGSAIFLHVMTPEGSPTAGCVALRPADLRRLLPRLAPRCWILVP